MSLGLYHYKELQTVFYDILMLQLRLDQPYKDSRTFVYDFSL